MVFPDRGMSCYSCWRAWHADSRLRFLVRCHLHTLGGRSRFLLRAAGAVGPPYACIAEGHWKRKAAVTVDVVGASDNDVRHKCQASMPPPSAIDEASDNGFSGNFGFEKQSQLVR